MNYLQKMAVVLCALLSMTAPTAVIAYMALVHNPQNEYIDANGGIEWDSLFALVSPALIVIGLALSFIVTMIALFIIKLTNQRKTT